MARKKSLTESIYPSRPKTYEEYLTEAGIDYRGDYMKSLSDARLASERERAGYGSSGERLSALGLEGSGYAAHLEEKRGEAAKRRLSLISEKKRDAARDSLSGYEVYLDDYERGQISAAKSIKSELLGSGATNKRELYSIARSLGADERHAELLAATVYEEKKNESLDKLLPELLAIGADYETAKRLALEMGLDDEAAGELAERVKFNYNGYGGYSDSYVKYLERLGSLTPYSTLTGGK